METDLRAGVERTYIDKVDDEFELSPLKTDETLTGVGIVGKLIEREAEDRSKRFVDEMKKNKIVG